MHAQRQIHTIFGAGQIGRLLAARLLERGHAVRIVRRGAPGPAREGLTWLQGDVTDLAFAREAARGADVVYHCTNPADYHRWDELLPPLYRGAREAAASSGARLVTLDNLYMYGPTPDGGPMREDTPMRPVSKKGALRARLYEELREAQARGELRLTTGRASDFFGPEALQSMVFHDWNAGRLAAGKRIALLCDPDVPHAFGYTEDVAAGLAVLGCHPAAEGRLFHLPNSFEGTVRELVAGIARPLGVPGRLFRVPGWVMRTVARVSPFVAAIEDERWQWDRPFRLDDGLFRATFGVAATPFPEAADATARWIRAHVDRGADVGRVLPAHV